MKTTQRFCDQFLSGFQTFVFKVGPINDFGTRKIQRIATMTVRKLILFEYISRISLLAGEQYSAVYREKFPSESDSLLPRQHHEVEGGDYEDEKKLWPRVLRDSVDASHVSLIDRGG